MESIRYETLPSRSMANAASAGEPVSAVRFENLLLAGTVGSGQAEKLSPMYGMLRESDLNVESETVRFA